MFIVWLCFYLSCYIFFIFFYIDLVKLDIFYFKIINDLLISVVG